MEKINHNNRNYFLVKTVKDDCKIYKEFHCADANNPDIIYIDDISGNQVVDSELYFRLIKKYTPTIITKDGNIYLAMAESTKEHAQEMPRQEARQDKRWQSNVFSVEFLQKLQDKFKEDSADCVAVSSIIAPYLRAEQDAEQFSKAQLSKGNARYVVDTWKEIESNWGAYFEGNSGYIAFIEEHTFNDKRKRMHEMTHKLVSFKDENGNLRNGLSHYVKKTIGDKTQYISEGTMLNEGAVELLTEKITGLSPSMNEEGYEYQTFFARHMVNHVGDSTFFSAMFQGPELLQKKMQELTGDEHAYMIAATSLDNYTVAEKKNPETAIQHFQTAFEQLVKIHTQAIEQATTKEATRIAYEKLHDLHAELSRGRDKISFQARVPVSNALNNISQNSKNEFLSECLSDIRRDAFTKQFQR